MSRSRQTPKESPSKRLRGVFYVLWEQNNEGFVDFEDYYDSKMLKLIEHYKKFIK